MTVYTPEKEIEQTKQSTTIGRLGRDAEYLHLRGMVAELLVYRGGGTIVPMGPFKSGKKVLVKALQDFGKEANCVVIQATVDPEKMNASLVDTRKGKEAKAAMARQPPRVARRQIRRREEGARERVAETMAAADGKGRRPGRQRGSVYVEETDEAQLGFTAWREVLDNLLGEVDAAFGLSPLAFIERALAAEQTLIDEGTPSSSPVAAEVRPRARPRPRPRPRPPAAGEPTTASPSPIPPRTSGRVATRAMTTTEDRSASAAMARRPSGTAAARSGAGATSRTCVGRCG